MAKKPQRHWINLSSQTRRVRGHPERRPNSLIRSLPYGAILRREFPAASGKLHEVVVIKPHGFHPNSGIRGYEYDGIIYRSLTAVAAVITDSKGTWSGPSFFGLYPRKKKR